MTFLEGATAPIYIAGKWRTTTDTRAVRSPYDGRVVGEFSWAGRKEAEEAIDAASAEAVAVANSTPYGLQAGIFTGDFAKAMRAVPELDFGAVLVNESPSFRADQMPYGGNKSSGNTREGPAYAAEEFSQYRTVIFRYGN